MISLVAITDAADRDVPSPLQAVCVGSLCAVYAPAEQAEEEPTIDALVAREELVDALLEGRDLLPIRYGASVADEPAAARVLEQRHGELRAALDRVRGAVELSVRVRVLDGVEEPSPAAATTGREYLSERTLLSGLATEIHGTLATRARAAVERAGPDLLRAAYLVDRSAVDAFVAEVRRLQVVHPELALLCTGPWAPYSFSAQDAAS